mgnify:CR=1 FL=1
MPKTVPCLWIDGQAEEAANYYVSVSPNSRVGAIVLDKTGTLTEGKPQLTRVVTTNGFEEQGLLRIAASAPYRPLRALVEPVRHVPIHSQALTRDS